MAENKNRHIEYQRQYFDRHYEFFRQPIPDEIEERTRLIVDASGVHAGSKVLDVGTGMGALVKHITAAGVHPEDITGCDLSAKMLEEARQRYPHAHFWQGDFAQFPAQPGSADAVFFNACFGNIIDQEQVIAVGAKALRCGGRIIISHPLGNRFVQQLHDQDPQLVLTLLPNRRQLQEWCDRFALELRLYRDEPEFYLSVLEKTKQPQ